MLHIKHQVIRNIFGKMFMNSAGEQFYTSPSQWNSPPTSEASDALPGTSCRVWPLADPSINLVRKSDRIVREMNSYYSNLIEGKDSAERYRTPLMSDYSSDARVRDNQILSPCTSKSNAQ